VQKAFTVESVANDLHLILQQFDIHECVMVGWSAGGVYAQCFAALYPQQTKALHLIGSSVPFAQEDADEALNARWNTVRILDRWVPFIAKPLFRKTSRKLHQEPDKVMNQLIKGLTESDKEVAAREPGYTLLKEAACDGLAHDGIGAYEEAKALGKAKIDYEKLCCPTHIWVGNDDSILPLKTSQYLHEHIKGSQMHVLNQTGHFLHIKEWKQLVTAWAA
jgi:pimeloyl-ACP methyl ester carboxylesterase